MTANSSTAPKKNGQKYREQTAGHATGRSGSAVLTGRGLLGKDGTVLVELTTGELDQPVAPGSISKVQLKFYHPAGTDMHEPTQNYNGLAGDGAWSNTYTEKFRHQQFQAQTNIRGIDRNRTDVVTITERINLRPDISVLSLNAPASAIRNASVAILASIGEMNDDLGATTNCVLYVNGTEADRSDGVWVADGDNVTCAFAHSFANVGDHNLTVKAESVVPGDWDTANNSKSATIRIIDPVLHGTAYAHQSEYDNSWYNYGGNNRGFYYTYYGGYNYYNRYENWNYYGYFGINDQYSSINGWTPTQLQFPLNVLTRHGTDGYDFDVRTRTVGTAGASCAYFSEPGFSISACASPGGSSYQSTRWGGYAYYYSSSYWNYYASQYWCDRYLGCGSWFDSGSYYYVDGPRFGQWGTWFYPYGNTATWDVEIHSAGGGVTTANATVPLTTHYDAWHYQPARCDYRNYGDYYNWQFYNACYSSTYRRNQKSGWAPF